MSSRNRFRVGVVGLGSMGMGAAKACIAANLETYGVDLRDEALKEVMAAGAKDAAVRGAGFAGSLDAVVLLPVSAEQCRDALFGAEGIARHLVSGTPVMVSSTESPGDARAIDARLRELGLVMLDAPVSGGSVKAAAGEVTVMASGSEEAFTKLRPVLDAMAGRVFRIGPMIGQGSTVKIIHQLLAGVHIAVAAEAMALASRAEIPLGTMYDVVTHAAGNSWMFENRMPHVLAGDYTARSSVDIFVKDLGLVMETARALAFPTPIASLAHSLFLNAHNAGYGALDDSAVIRNYAGVSLPPEQRPPEQR